jgi:YVTN family beta-propeller protein
VPKAIELGTNLDVYAAAHAGMLSPAVAGDVKRVYVPNSEDNTVDVIDPATYRVVAHFAVGKLPQHVTPSWDLKTLYVDNDIGNTLTPIDARTGKPGKAIPVEDPYNLYFTADGTKAIVVAERFNRLDFRDPRSFTLIKSVHVPCRGVDHMDYTADARFALVSCEFSGQMLKLDLQQMSVASVFALGSSPQDVKLSPDGRTFYVADQNAGGVFLVDAATFERIGFLATGRGAHGLYVSRDSSFLYVADRGAGQVTVIDVRTKEIVHQWHIGGSPDMGGVSADGTQLWLSGRHNSVVYVIDTRTGKLAHTIKVGRGPHGLCVFPQPGRYSIGHTGILR